MLKQRNQLSIIYCPLFILHRCPKIFFRCLWNKMSETPFCNSFVICVTYFCAVKKEKVCIHLY